MSASAPASTTTKKKGQRILAYRSSCQPLDYLPSSIFFTEPPTTITDNKAGHAFSIQQNIGGAPFSYNNFAQFYYDRVTAYWILEAYSKTDLPGHPTWTVVQQVPFFDPTKDFLILTYDHRVFSLSVTDPGPNELRFSYAYRLPDSVGGTVYNASLGVVGAGDGSEAFLNPCTANIVHETIPDITDMAAYVIPSKEGPYPCVPDVAFTSYEGSNLSQTLDLIAGNQVSIVTDTSSYI